tara:strand:+ start:531 stop:650 length:120 start_codon:yes stop_codon:yes gene_type:complete
VQAVVQAQEVEQEVATLLLIAAVVEAVEVLPHRLVAWSG